MFGCLDLPPLFVLIASPEFNARFDMAMVVGSVATMSLLAFARFTTRKKQRLVVSHPCSFSLSLFRTSLSSSLSPLSVVPPTRCLYTTHHACSHKKYRRIVFHIEIKHLQHPHQQPWTTPKEGSLINWILMSISRGQKIL